MISVEEALRIIGQNVGRMPSEAVPLAEARGRTLRAAVLADADQPGFDRSAMDGYAVAAEGDEAGYAVVGILRAGDNPDFSLTAGQCARVFTGARVPAGAIAVIPQEDVESDGTTMQPHADRRAGGPTFIRLRGEDARAGDVLAPAGRILRSAEVGILASAGVVRPVVAVRPRVVHLVTGDELVEPEETPGEGQIRDSNSALVAALVAEAGGVVTQRVRVPEDREISLRLITELAAAAAFDMLLISGGASVGDHDHAPAMLEQGGFTIHFQQVSVRPGKPLIFATRGRQIAFAIPGNPVSHFATFHLFIRPALDALLGREAAPSLFRAPLAAALPEPPNPRETYWPARVTGTETGLALTPLRWQSSGHLSSLDGADALIRVPARTAPMPAGMVVEWLRV